MSAQDTIVALSSPVGESALAIIRLSGPLSAELQIEITRKKSRLTERHATLCKYHDIKGLELDSALFLSFSEGASFTGEAMLEIMPHGNPLIIHKILEDLLSRGCKMAEPGEFTRRAFLNGKMDLSQAEAVADLIHARSNYSLEVARKQLNGSIGHKMSALTDQLLEILSEIEAYIDFPEEDLPLDRSHGPVADLKALIEEVSSLIETNQYSSLLHDGIKTLIIGAPNAGKSSLINALVGSQRAIVSDVPGTTRDFIASYIMLESHRVEIIDTAGLHLTEDSIEQQGINKTLEQAQSADFFLLIMDSSQPPPVLPAAISAILKPNNTIVIENKIDLAESKACPDYLKDCLHCPTSIIQKQGIEEFKKSWQSFLDKSLGLPNSKDAIVLNTRHTQSLKDSLAALNEALQKLDSQEFSELVALDLRTAIDGFSQVVGKIDNEAMLDKLFQKFCIGK